MKNKGENLLCLLHPKQENKKGAERGGRAQRRQPQAEERRAGRLAESLGCDAPENTDALTPILGMGEESKNRRYGNRQ